MAILAVTTAGKNTRWSFLLDTNGRDLWVGEVVCNSSTTAQGEGDCPVHLHGYSHLPLQGR